MTGTGTVPARSFEIHSAKGEDEGGAEAGYFLFL
jgi:hypothetical protein